MSTLFKRKYLFYISRMKCKPLHLFFSVYYMKILAIWVFDVYNAINILINCHTIMDNGVENMKRTVSLGLLGLGVVGSGVIKLIEEHQEKLTHQLGCGVDVKKVLVRNLEKARDVQVKTDYLTTDPDAVLHNPEIDVVVEVMGGIDGAKEHILEAFTAKKHVVTANKDLIALHGPELEKAANDNQCDLFYEASVAGGIPILRGLADGLASDRIEQVMGIV